VQVDVVGVIPVVVLGTLSTIANWGTTTEAAVNPIAGLINSRQ